MLDIVITITLIELCSKCNKMKRARKYKLLGHLICHDTVLSYVMISGYPHNVIEDAINLFGDVVKEGARPNLAWW